MPLFYIAKKVGLNTFSERDIRSEEQRLNSSHSQISYAVFCLKKKNVRSPGGAAGLALPGCADARRLARGVPSSTPPLRPLLARPRPRTGRRMAEAHPPRLAPAPHRGAPDLDPPEPDPSRAPRAAR